MQVTTIGVDHRARALLYQNDAAHYCTASPCHCASAQPVGKEQDDFWEGD